MHRLFFPLLALAAFLIREHALAFPADASESTSTVLDNCTSLLHEDVPRFVYGSVHFEYHGTNFTFGGADGVLSEDDYYAAVLRQPDRTIVLSNYWCAGTRVITPDGDVTSTNTCDSGKSDEWYVLWVEAFGLLCGEYIGNDSVAYIINLYLAGESISDAVTDRFVTEQHNGSYINLAYTEIEHSWDGTLESSNSYHLIGSKDGAVLPTLNLNHGRDKVHCVTNCSGCTSHGMPSWSISEPFLNVWVHDTPVFYTTSLGQEIGFTVNYKQRDTRPRDDGAYPITGWNHNWYSYVRFTTPVNVAANTGSTNLTGVISARGYWLRNGWVLTNDFTKWEAILYAPDNSESYYRAGQNGDPQNQRQLVPIQGADGISGFRCIYGDGSQDVYTLVLTNGRTYGIVERYGCIFDKKTLSRGMEGVWRLQLGGPDSPHHTWQAGDDAANYTTSEVNNDPSLVQRLDYYTDPQPPPMSEPLEFISGDALLTARLDPYGNAIQLEYESNRLARIVDYDNRTNHLTYDTNGFLKTVTMQYGRQASFSHDAQGKLMSVTDAAGMSSYMDYTPADGGTNSRLHSLSTPYGTTTFDYQDGNPYATVPKPAYYSFDTSSGDMGVVQDPGTLQVYRGEQNVNHAVIITHPDNSKELYFYCGVTNASVIPASLDVSQAVQDAAGGTLDNGKAPLAPSLRRGNSFHWRRAQTPHLSMPVSASMALTNLTAADFLIGTWQHFPVEVAVNGSANVNLSTTPSFIRDGSPDGQMSGKITWFVYSNQQLQWERAGEPLDMNVITEAPDGTALISRFEYDHSCGALTSITEPYTQENGFVGERHYTWAYTLLDVQEAEGPVWYLPVLTGIETPFGRVDAAVNAAKLPTLTNVNEYPAVSWPEIEVYDAESRPTTYYFDSRHKLTGIHNANGLDVSNSYRADGFLEKSIALQAQATNTFVFENGELVSRTTPLGLTINFTHDKLGRLTSAAFPDQTTISNIYEKLQVGASKDRLGHWTHYSYDCFGALTNRVDPNYGVTTFKYCSCGGLEQVVDPENTATTYGRDYLGRVITVSSPSGNLTIERDILGRPHHIFSDWADRLDLRIGHNYQGLVTGITNRVGPVLGVIYNEHDLPVSVTDASGISMTYDFDLLRRLRTRSNSRFQVEEFEYSNQGLSKYWDAERRETFYGYDSAGRLSAITNANHEVTTIGHDIPHRRMSLTDGRDNTKWWAFDAYGRQIAETNANAVLVRTNGYDANSRLTSQWTKAKGITTFDRDNNGNVITVHYPSNAVVGYTYDHLDRLRTMADAVGNHTFTYTNFGAFDWAFALESGPFGTVSHGHSGPNLNSIGFGGVSIGIERDVALRPETLYSTAAGNFRYHYRGAGRQLDSIDGPHDTTSFLYDEIGRMTNVQVNASGQLVDYHGYAYDDNSRVRAALRRAFPDHPLQSIKYAYDYDNIGQLKAVTATEPDNSTDRLNDKADFNYDASGNLTSRTANSFSQVFNSDALNQLTNIIRSGTLTVSGSFTGAVAKLGVNGTQAQIYSDSTFATTTGLTLSNANNFFVTAGSNAANQLVLSTLTVSDLPETVSFVYDGNGNLRSDGQRLFEYDDADRLVAVSVTNACRIEFTYDGLSRRRVMKEYGWQWSGWVKTNETRYVCDGYVPVQERDGNGNVRVTYTRGLDFSGTFGGAGGIGGLLARTEGSASTYYHSDNVGNITSLTDASGQVVARYLYDPFGRLVGKWGALADANVMQFSSMPLHRQAGLVGYAFRFYDPSLQRWLNQDPIGEAGGVNLYGFLGNNPINNIDPLGLTTYVSSTPFPDDDPRSYGPYTKTYNDGSTAVVDGTQLNKLMWDDWAGAQDLSMYYWDVFTFLQSVPRKAADVIPSVVLWGKRKATQCLLRKAAKEPHANSTASQRPTEHYRIVDSKGKPYDGVGDVNGNRANESLERLRKQHPEETFRTDNRTPYDNRADALKAEDRAIWSTGGPQGRDPNGANYNVINSPGHRLNIE